MSPDLTLVFALVVVAVLQLGGTALLLRWCLVRAAPHEALVLTKLGAPSRLVSFSQVLALPLVARVDVVDLSLRRVVITREGKAGVRCRDGVRADMEVVFVVGVERTVESVLRAAESLGTSRVNDERAVAEHFTGPSQTRSRPRRAASTSRRSLRSGRTFATSSSARSARTSRGTGSSA